MSDHLIRVLTLDGAIRVSVAATTALVEEVRRRQQTDPTATVAVGRLATAAALMGSLLKGRQRIGLTVEGNGPLQRLQAEADAYGRVRATLKVPLAGLPPRDGRFDVAGAVGRAGFLHVVKDLDMKEPYRGMVQLVSSEIAEDLAYYFTTSEQTPSSVALGVELGQQAEVAAAGGFLLQLMPDASDDLAERLAERLGSLPPTTSSLRQGLGPEAIVEQLLQGFPYQTLGTIPLSFACNCSQEQTLGLLRTLGADELDQLIAEAGETRVTCEYCKETYTVDRATLQGVRASL
ncbi:MAG: Hsp33 family molecular chaperone HslO [Desulfuromonadales bacterium]|jgi:molecular chaperone Hsp33|nr:Hsp33 family molecular chaperone HslO [Desulfuromonadales bacterium]